MMNPTQEEIERQLRKTRNKRAHVRASRRKEQRKIDLDRLTKDLAFEEKMERRAREESRKDKAVVKRHLKELSRLYKCLGYARGGEDIVGPTLAEKIDGLEMDVEQAMSQLKQSLWKINFFQNLDPGKVEFVGGYIERRAAFFERSRYWKVKRNAPNMPWNN